MRWAADRGRGGHALRRAHSRLPGNGTVNTLRLWKAQAAEVFALHDFNRGDYTTAVQTQNKPKTSRWCSTPMTNRKTAKKLRLRQQYFLASASLQDILRRWTAVHGENFSKFAEKNVFQLNDTHPTVAVAELMRLLMDEHGLDWDEAWGITTKTMAYTNHTLLPEALEKWSLELFKTLLPRPLEIILEINARFMRSVANKWPGDSERQARMSIIEDGPNPQVRMAYLAIVGSFSVNGVAELHSELPRGPVQRLLRTVAGEIQQQDQWRHPASLAGLVQPPAQQGLG